MTISTGGLAAALSFAVLILGATPGSAVAQSVNDVARLTGADRQAKLEAGAKKEGEFLLYTAQLVEDGVRPMQEAFAKKYPFVKFNFYRAASPGLVQRILSETRAGKPVTDVVIGSTSAALNEAKLLQPFASPHLAEYPKAYLEPTGLWATVRSTYNGIAYNSKLVTAAEAPQTWEALLEPRWKGKMLWINDLGTGGPLLIHHLREQWGEKKAEEYFAKLKQQNIGASSASNQAALDLLIAGEHQLLVSAALHQVVRALNEKAPVNFTAPDPVIARPEHIMLLNSAPHPHAAMLYIDYVLSQEGQRVMAANSYLPAHPNVDAIASMQAIVPRVMGKKEVLYGPETTTGNADILMDTFNRISQ